MEQRRKERGLWVERRSRRECDGFSLVEMLVVIALLAVLLGLSTAVISGMKEKARIAISRDTAKQLAESWTRYLQEVGQWPPSIAGTGDTTEFHADANHIKMLNQGTGYTLFETKKVERDSGGSIVDSWKNTYSLFFDTDYDGQIAHPLLEGEIIKAHVVVVSPGKDGELGTKDDILVY